MNQTFSFKLRLQALLLAFALCFTCLSATGCSAESTDAKTASGVTTEQVAESSSKGADDSDADLQGLEEVEAKDIESAHATQGTGALSSQAQFQQVSYSSYNIEDLPEYNGKASVDINFGVPSFTAEDFERECFEDYSQLDWLGRCGVAFAHICPKTQPTEKRGSIGSVHPTGWHSSTYAFVDGRYLYNRCHLIGYQLAGENANPYNLITGTRYLNIKGMLPFEDRIDDYVDSTGKSVLLRVTPVYDGDNLVARGVQMEAASVEDRGESLSFNVFCYNVQPGVSIDYSTGDNEPTDPDAVSEEAAEVAGAVGVAGTASIATSTNAYVANKNSMKFHVPSCSSANKISAKNRYDFSGTRDELVAMGYAPCKRCNP